MHSGQVANLLQGQHRNEQLFTPMVNSEKPLDLIYISVGETRPPLMHEPNALNLKYHFKILLYCPILCGCGQKSE